MFKRIVLFHIYVIDSVLDSNFYKDTIWFHKNSLSYIDPKTNSEWKEFILQYPVAYVGFIKSMREDRKLLKHYDDE